MSQQLNLQQTSSYDWRPSREAVPVPYAAIHQHVAYIEKMVAQGGPFEHEHATFAYWLANLATDIRSGRIPEADLNALRNAFGPALSLSTLQGFSMLKPHGYAGDFEIIDRIYREHLSDDPQLRRWDVFFHAQSAPKAVRNRKVYFKRLMAGLVQGADPSEALPVLNVASGPARDIAEFFSEQGADPRLTFDCVDSDARAIRHAREVCKPYLEQIDFQQVNALRYTSDRRYKLVWSAGLFDYFAEKGFKFLLERLLVLVEDGGELVVGNFSKKNGTRDYMEIVGDWHLHYRSEEDLVAMARSCGVRAGDIRIGKEPEGVNLFLHIKRGKRFIAMD